jgi:hypothetical protein
MAELSPGLRREDKERIALESSKYLSTSEGGSDDE